MVRSGLSSMRGARLGSLILCALLAVTAVSGATDLESRARDLEGKLMAPCCGANTVREHDSGAAMEMRAEIRRMLSEGRTEEEILDFYVAKHGTKILAMPEARGFNLVPYLVPMLLLVLGAVFVYVAMRRWRGGPAAEAPVKAVAKLDPAYLERLERDIGQES